MHEGVQQVFGIEGFRGVGKTVLLGRAVMLARDAGWGVLELEATSDTSLAELARQARVAMHEIGVTRAGTRLRQLLGQVDELTVGVSAGVVKAEARLSTPAHQVALDALLELAQTARNRGAGIFIAIDEAQRAESTFHIELGRLLSTSAAREFAVVALIAGLPGLRDAVVSEVTYAERARWIVLEGLNDDAARIALLQPFAELGIAIESDVAERTLQRCMGYPYFIQLFGEQLWRAAAAVETDRIGPDEAKIAFAECDLILESFYRGRVAKTTDTEREYLMALAQFDGPTSSSEVAEAVGRAATSAAKIRGSLLRKALITAPSYGKVDIEFPGFREFLRKS